MPELSVRPSLITQSGRTVDRRGGGGILIKTLQEHKLLPSTVSPLCEIMMQQDGPSSLSLRLGDKRRDGEGIHITNLQCPIRFVSAKPISVTGREDETP